MIDTPDDGGKKKAEACSVWCIKRPYK